MFVINKLKVVLEFIIEDFDGCLNPKYLYQKPVVDVNRYCCNQEFKVYV